MNDQGFLRRGRARATYELGVSKLSWEHKSLLQLDLLLLYHKYQKLHKFKLVSRNRPKSRNISQYGRMDCQQSWGCIIPDKNLLSGYDTVLWKCKPDKSFLPQVGFCWLFYHRNRGPTGQLLNDNLSVSHWLPPYEVLVRGAPEATKEI